jgi:hypothetical protein
VRGGTSGGAFVGLSWDVVLSVLSWDVVLSVLSWDVVLSVLSWDVVLCVLSCGRGAVCSVLWTWC